MASEDPIGIGKRSYTLIAKQTDYDTEASTGFVTIPALLDETIEAMTGKVPNESAFGDNNPNAMDAGNVAVAGNVKGYVLDEDFGDVVNFVFGGLTKTTPSGQTNARRHQFSYKADRDEDVFASYLTIRQTRGGGLEEQFIGAMATGLTIEATQSEDGAFAMFTMPVAGGEFEDEQPRTSSITLPSGQRLQARNINVELAPISGTYATLGQVKSVSISIDNMLHATEYSLGEEKADAPERLNLPAISVSTEILSLIHI